MLLETLDANFPTVGDRPSDAAAQWRVRQGYGAAAETLAGGGVATRPDGADSYLAERLRWEPLVARVAPTLGYTMTEIDTRSARHRD